MLKQHVSRIFPPLTGGAKTLAVEMNVPFLGDIELDPRLGKCCDSGKSFFQNFSESRVSIAYKRICKGKFYAIIFDCFLSIFLFYTFLEDLIELLASKPAQ